MNYDYQPPYENGFSTQLQPPPPVKKDGNGFAIASLVLGILSIPLLCCCALSIISAVLSIVFAFVARSKAGKMPTMAKVGMILAIIVIVFAVFFIGMYFYIINEAVNNPDGEIAGKVDEFFRQYYGKSFQELLKEAENGNVSVS